MSNETFTCEVERLLGIADKLIAGRWDEHALEKMEREKEEFREALASGDEVETAIEGGDVAYYAAKTIHNGQMTPDAAFAQINTVAEMAGLTPEVIIHTAIRKMGLRAREGNPKRKDEEHAYASEYLQTMRKVKDRVHHMANFGVGMDDIAFIRRQIAVDAEAVADAAAAFVHHRDSRRRFGASLIARLLLESVEQGLWGRGEYGRSDVPAIVAPSRDLILHHLRDIYLELLETGVQREDLSLIVSIYHAFMEKFVIHALYNGKIGTEGNMGDDVKEGSFTGGNFSNGGFVIDFTDADQLLRWVAPRLRQSIEIYFAQQLEEEVAQGK